MHLKNQRQHLMKAVDEYDGIIVVDQIRFGRDTFDLLFQIKTLEEQKKQLIFVKQAFARFRNWKKIQKES